MRSLQDFLVHLNSHLNVYFWDHLIEDISHKQTPNTANSKVFGSHLKSIHDSLLNKLTIY